MSILRTAADQRDPRPMVLIYSVRSPDRIVFRDELAAIERKLRLSTAYIVSAPPPGWFGLRGRITTEVLDLVLPDDLRGWQFLVCGPPPFVDASLDALLHLGIPTDRVHAERFVGV
jgi:ferredoxin-NADP reductase